MLFYFSGTGNSKWVATQIANQLGEELTNIASEPKDKHYRFTNGDIVGIVFPVYAWNSPEIVRDFAKKIDSNGAFTFAVCTCGGTTGYTIRHLSKLLPLDSGYSIKMPSNYIIGSADVNPESLVKEKLETAKETIDRICREVQNKEHHFDVPLGSIPWIRSSIIAAAFNKFGKSTKPFSVDEDSCTGCGLCQMICPSKAITLTDGHPVWMKEKCEQCLGCINRCPVRAINYGEKTAEKGRYYFKE